MAHHYSGKLKVACSLAASWLAIGGCTGSGDGGGTGSNPPPPPPPPGAALGGLWSGAVFWDARNGFPGGALNIRALVAETGEFRFVLYEEFEDRFSSGNEQIFGSFHGDDDEIRTSGDAVWAAQLNETGDDWAAFGMVGDYLAGESIEATFQANFSGWMHSEERVGTLSLNYHSLYESPSSFAILQGSYRTPDAVLTVDAQGVIFYQSAADGCTANGLAEIIDPEYNMYRVMLDVGGCTGDAEYRNGLTFTGLANVGENNDWGGGFLNSTLEMAVSALRGLPFGSGYVPWSLLAHKD